MLKTVEAVNTLNLAVKNKKTKLKIKINPSIKKVLNILVDYNVIEYSYVNSSVADVCIKYKDSSPILKSINYMGGNYKNNVTCQALQKELNNKRSSYIILTDIGMLSLESAVKNKRGGIILFKLTV